ncbi:Z1 domain-containing protein [Streptomyces sp. UNOC14_S4]|uniref:Z1 domain-containing protein n=1 Tax=Streptomyces sp. UNOC14_S4 TaxID=2872340 RepID=UPI001E2A6F17|nr:Z1 domain-containing protein [Streptomyces sp. UNOC14_S4]MCC3767190.1 Z1 domain-containing protein [Streptomyces sp. UNOC14_S4]
MPPTDDNNAQAFLELHRSALAAMRAGRPIPLASSITFYAAAQGLALDTSEAAFRHAIISDGEEAGALLRLWRKHLTDWDYAADAATDTWCEGAEARTDERRTRVFDLLGLESTTRKLLEDKIPVNKHAGPVVISQEYVPWRGIGAPRGVDWYWPAYERYLRDTKGWSDGTVADLGEAAERVVERLADPTSAEAYQSKGLVVGYVQSGKTANFTGVIAKAIDAGYRLVIVLGGTLNLLRGQTQRRLDMELVGRENILRGTAEAESDYAADLDWLRGRFVSHSGLPSERGGFDIERLTTRENDYKSLAQGIRALQIEKREKSLPLHDPRNLDHAAVRLMVVKKNKTVLTKLVKDLKKISGLLGEIPTLIIDDESDEASVNTINSRRHGSAERTAINKKLSELLSLLPRAQYVGYTATPFANVFIDPSDSEDIFPKDFLISLARPQGYMGVQDFHDLDPRIPIDERTVADSNELAYIRSIDATEEENDDLSLRRAMDMFVLTAAVKIFRETEDPHVPPGKYRHHTMLVHESRLTADHRELKGRILRLWDDSGYTSSTGHERLRELFESDLLPVSLARANGYAVPETFEKLAPYVGAATARIGGDLNPVIVVNGDKDIESGEADFESRSIWKILLGGQKLSRGFTVEGLTVSYYRRRAGNASTMMQMGRWFGFREGYRDLVRLWIGRNETAGSKELDLYEGFEAICQDEESFRAQLAQYSVLVDGHPQVTPAQVPPLVSQRLPWLKPTSPNKMYNARLVELRSPGDWQEPTAYPTQPAALAHNTDLWTPVLENSSGPTVFSHRDQASGRVHRFSALTSLLQAHDLLAILSSLKWSHDHQFAPHLTYLEAITKAGQVEDWLVLAPQHASEGKRAVLASDRVYSWFGRHRRRGPLFGAISEPKHRPVAHRIAGVFPSCGDTVTERYAAERRGVVTLYPVVEPGHRDAVVETGRLDPRNLVTAFSFITPASAVGTDGKVVRFTTIDSSDDPIIELQTQAY